MPADFERSYRLGGGEHFVVEGDEYDSAFFDKRPKFVHYLPDVAIIGNVEYDHADIYPDLAAVQRAFAQLLNLVPRRGLVVAGLETPALREILPRAKSPRADVRAGPAEADWRAVDVGPAAEAAGASGCPAGQGQGEFTLSAPGRAQPAQRARRRRGGQRGRGGPRDGARDRCRASAA